MGFVFKFLFQYVPPSEEWIVKCFEKMTTFNDELNNRASEILIGDCAVNLAGEES